MINKECLLTDEEILDNLRHKIKMISINDQLNTYFGEKEWENLKDEMLLKNSLKIESGEESRPIYCYKMPPAKESCGNGGKSNKLGILSLIENSRVLKGLIFVIMLGIIFGISWYGTYLWGLGF